MTAARLESGRGVGDLADATRIRATVIEAIERDEFNVCGADVYARGHVKALAAQLGLDPAQLAASYDEQQGVSQRESVADAGGGRRSRWLRRG